MRLVFTFLALVSVGCTEQTAVPDDVSSAPPVRPPDRVLVEPGDLMTSIGQNPLELVVGLVGDAPTDDELEALTTERVSVWSASGQQIPVTLRVVETGPDQRPVRSIEISHEEALALEWHEVRVNLNGTGLDPHPAMVPVGAGVFRSRFHPGSAPVMRRVALCMSPTREGATDVVLDFSEPMTFLPDGRQVAPVQVAIDGASCGMLTTHVEEPGGDSFATAYQYRCAHLASFDELTVTLTGQLSSASSGEPALLDRTAPERSAMTLTFDDSYDLGECRYWHLP